jgi:replication factor C small subunit
MADAAGGRQEIWVEKYRPERLEDVVGHPDITERLQSYVDRDDLPHLLFAGPAGTGKCLTGETPVLTNDGVERVEDVVGDVDGFESPRPDLEVATFTEDGDFEYAAPSDVFSRQADETVTVSTRDGGEFTVTPEHPLLTVDGEGLSWTPAEELMPGDRVARPLHAPTPGGDGRIDWYEAMDGDRTLVHLDDGFAATAGIPAEENYVGAKKRVVRELRRHGDADTASDVLDVPSDTVEAYANDVADRDLSASSTVCSLAYLRDRFDYDDVANYVESIQYVNANNLRSAPITPPERVDASLARFLGLVVSEARVDGGRLRFYNEDEQLLEHVEATLEDEFGLTCERRERKGVPFVHAISATLTAYLEACFDVTGDGIASTLLGANVESRSAFLRAVFDAEGHVTTKGAIELSQKDGEFVSALTYLLAGFGIPARRKREQKAATNGSGVEREYHTLYISGARDLARFEEEVGFTVEEKASRLADAAARDPNSNHDTVPVQESVDLLCRRLNLQKKALVGELCSDARSREQYLSALDDVLEAAEDRLDAAQAALDSLESMEYELAGVTGAATAWVENRSRLEPLDERNAIADVVGARTDRLLEYADGRRTPTGRRIGQLLAELGVSEPNVETVQETLEGARRSLGVSYEELADGTPYRGVAVNNLLTNDDHSLRSLTRFETVAAELERAAERMLSLEVAAQMRSLELLASADLYYDAVQAVERNDEPTRVYDLTVPETHNFVAGNVPTTMHNTASAVSIAKEIYEDDWQDNFLELNASDERGIDVVRDRIKDFARSSFGGHDYRVIFLDEADALTDDAQSALRRTMEQFSNNTRFILSCNYSSKIIDPIQSRCAVFRFAQLGDDAVADHLRTIAENESLDYTADGIDALVYAADGDMRRAINALQAASATGEIVDEETVYAITATARPEEIEEMVTEALGGDFTAARATLDDLLTNRGLAGGDIIDQIHRSVWNFDVEEAAAVRLLDRLGEADYRIAEGANERVQLEALLASVALNAEESA